MNLNLNEVEGSSTNRKGYFKCKWMVLKRG